MPIQVYLDSSDFSVLSNSSLNNKEFDDIREKLISYSESGLVDFRFSSAHIVESAPTDENSIFKANERANFISLLCGKKALISFEKILEGELLHITTGIKPNPYSEIGDWFPELTEDFFPSQEKYENELFEIFNERIKNDDALNREQKRERKRAFLKNGKITETLKNALKLQHNQTSINSLMEKLPIKEDSAKTLLNYLNGKATRKKASEAINENLRDPSFVINWLGMNFQSLGNFNEWLRGPARNNALAVQKFSMDAQLLREKYLVNGVQNTIFTEKSELLKMQIRLLIGLSNEFSLKFNIKTNINEIDNFQLMMPGISTCINTFSETTWDSLKINIRKPKNSDFIDAIHATYAPYVDIFRADIYMAPIIKKYSKTYGTSIIGKLNELIPEIENQLKKTKT